MAKPHLALQGYYQSFLLRVLLSSVSALFHFRPDSTLIFLKKSSKAEILRTSKATTIRE